MIEIEKIRLGAATLQEVDAGVRDYLETTIRPAEGGYTNDPNDPGGETNWGITIADARAAGYAGRMVDLTWAQATEIYLAKYWRSPGFDLLAQINLPLALELFDLGINQGDSTVCKYPQQVLQAFGFYAGAIDGAFGPMSRNATQEFLAKRGQDGLRVLYMSIRAYAFLRYVELVRANSALAGFLFGWLAQRAFPQVKGG